MRRVKVVATKDLDIEMEKEKNKDPKVGEQAQYIVLVIVS